MSKKDPLTQLTTKFLGVEDARRVLKKPERSEYEFVMETTAQTADLGVLDRPRCVIGVSTFNRVDYIREFVNSFTATRSTSLDWTLIIADDGSTDGTLAYLDGIDIPGCNIIIIKNHGAGIAVQTNHIFRIAQAIGFDYGFKADDDLVFHKAGWDLHYIEAMRTGGFEHLVHYDVGWKPVQHQLSKGDILESLSGWDHAMGCFWTYTPRVLDAVGYFDEQNFQVRGHAHWDFTVRACRLGFNELGSIWQPKNSNEYVRLQPREGYKNSLPVTSAAVAKVITPEERVRRMGVIQDETRSYLSFDAVSLDLETPRLKVVESRSGIRERLEESGYPIVDVQLNAAIDGVYVLNLKRDRDSWDRVSMLLRSRGLNPRRNPGIFAMDERNYQDWLAYKNQGIQTDAEAKLGRRMIDSPGAWAYTSGALQAIKDAKSRRYNAIALFDDDITVHKDFERILVSALNELPNNWQLTYLGCRPIYWDRSRRYSGNLIRHLNRVDGSYGVVIHSSAFDAIIAKGERREGTFDSDVLGSITRRYKYSTYQTWPAIVAADVRSSSLRNRRSQEDYATKQRWDMSDFVDQFDDEEEQSPRLIMTPQPYVSVLFALDGKLAGARRAIRQVLAQSMANSEILVSHYADDAAALEAAKRYLELDPRVRIVEVEGGQGSSVLLNNALAVARSPHVVLGERSDRWHVDHLETMFNALNQDEGECVALAKYYDGDDIDLYSITNNLPLQFMASRSLVHRSVIEAVGGFYSEKIPQMLDVLVRYASLIGPKHPRMDRFKVASKSTVSAISADENRNQAIDFALSGSVQGLLQGWTPMYGNFGANGGTTGYRVIEQG